MNMNFDNSNEAPRHRSLSVNFNSAPIPAVRGAQIEDTERVRPCTITEVSINPSDVLCGRGKLSFNHVGNRRFRELVSGAVSNYNEAESRLAKATVVNSIVEEIKLSGGRFLRQDDDAGPWHTLNHTQCREKVGHAIRDATSSIEARKKRQRLQEQTRKNVVGAIFSKPPPTSFTALNATPHKSDMSDMRAEKSCAIMPELQPSSKSQKLFVVEGQDRLSAPSDFLQGLQQQTSSKISDGLQDIHPEKIGSRIMRTLSTQDDDEQFLAYIDQVLGPLPPTS